MSAADGRRNDRRTDQRNTSPKGPLRHPAGRICHCGTIISIYTPGDQCSHCEET